MKNPFREIAIRKIPSFHHEHKSYRWWVLVNVMIITFMSVLETTVVNVALPSMMNSFGTNLDTIEWVMTAYQLIFAVMLPLSGWLADKFGYKISFFLSLIVFTIGSFLCSFAWNENVLIFFRVIQGIGGGLIMPLGMAIITREFPPEQRGMALGFWGISAAASISIGPSFGGYLVDNFGWSSVFLINVPIGIVGAIATVVIQREYKHHETKAFDFVGFSSISIFLVSLLLALADGNAAWNTGGWTSPFILVCFAISAVSIFVFLYSQFTVKNPILDLRLLAIPNFAITNALLFIFGLGLMGSTFLLPLYLQGTLGYSALLSGLVFLPLGIVQGLMSPIAGVLSDRLGPKFPSILGLVLLTVSLFMNAFLTTLPAKWLIDLPIYLRGLGFGLMFTPLQSFALADIPREKMAQASSMINLIRQIGSSFGVAIFASIMSQRNSFHMAVAGEGINPYSESFRQAAAQLQSQMVVSGGQTPSSAMTLSQVAITQQVTVNAFVQSIDDVFMVVSIMTLACLIPLVLLKNPPKKVKHGHAKPADKNAEHAVVME